MRHRRQLVVNLSADDLEMQGFEIGSGFEGSTMLGSDHNDEFYMADGEVRTRTNRLVILDCRLLSIHKLAVCTCELIRQWFISRAGICESCPLSPSV